MTDKLPPNLLKLFHPRPPLKYVPPSDRALGERTGPQISGVGAFVQQLHDGTHDSDYVGKETAEQGRQRRLDERKRLAKESRDRQLEEWKCRGDSMDTAEGSTKTSDPFKTLFVGRLGPNVDEKMLLKELQVFGPIKQIQMVYKNNNGQRRSYAFVEYNEEKDLKAAVRDAHGLKFDGKRIIVDVERGRTVDDWKPRRLGGGLGGKAAPAEPRRRPVSPPPPSYRDRDDYRGGRRPSPRRDDQYQRRRDEDRGDRDRDRGGTRRDERRKRSRSPPDRRGGYRRSRSRSPKRRDYDRYRR